MNIKNISEIEEVQRKKIQIEVEDRWRKLGFLDDIKGHIVENVATLFEAQSKQLLNETSNDNTVEKFDALKKNKKYER